MTAQLFENTKPVESDGFTRLDSRNFQIDGIRQTFFAIDDNLDRTADGVYADLGPLGTGDLPALRTQIGVVFCKDIKLTRKEKVTLTINGATTEYYKWLIVVTYESIIGSNSSTDPAEDALDPEDRTPTWRWTSETIEEVVEDDKETEEPIRNSAKEQIILTAPRPIAVLTIERYKETSDTPAQTEILNYQNTVNETPFWGFPERCCLLQEIEDSPVNINGTVYRLRRYVIKINLRTDKDGDLIGWQSYVLDQGTRYKESAADTTYVPFQDEHRNPTTGLLKDDGTALPAADDPEWLNFNRFPKTELNDLKLGPTVWS
tara:strand:+ start:6244 stop:7197 length:954 start_codon:yes stop_codon:yes gene_type:complete